MKKAGKIVSILTILLTIVLISILSFGGLYVKKQNRMDNILPDYLLGIDLNGGREVHLKIDDTTNEVVYDKDGKIIESPTDEDKENKENKVENIPVNKQESLTAENFEKSKEIIEQRIIKAGITDYKVRQLGNGDIFLTLPEYEGTDNLLSAIYTVGKFEILDADTKEVLLDDTYISSSRVGYGNDTTGATNIYLTIEFNKEGTKKLEEISKTYVSSKNDKGEDTTKKVSLEIDGEELLSTYFGQTITTGQLQLTIGSSASSSGTLDQALLQGSNLALLLDCGKLPLTYKISEQKYIASDITSEIVTTLLYVAIAIAIIILIGLTLCFRTRGLYLGLANIGYVALLLLVLRFTNVNITILGVLGIILSAVLTLVLSSMLAVKMKKTEKLTKEAFMNLEKNTLVSFVMVLIPIAILAVVSCFANYLPLISLGMILFWGMLVIVIYYIFIIRNLLISTIKE